MRKSSFGKSLLYVTPYFAPAWSYGGTVKVSYDFAKQLVKMGNRVTVATTDALNDKSRNPSTHEILDGIEIIRFKNVSNSLAKSSNLYTPIGLTGWLKKNINKFDLVHIHEFFTYQSIATSKICLKYNVPYAVQPHGSLQPYAKEAKFRHIKRFIINNFASLALKSQVVIVLTEKEEKDVKATYPQIKDKIKIAPNGIDAEGLKKIKRVDIHKRYGIPKQNRVIGFLGRIHFQKGLDSTLKAMSLLKDELEVTFLIIGPNEGERANLEKLAKKLGLEKQIVFAGLMTGDKKLETLKSADLSILLSRSEGLPTTLLESAGLGLPIICSKECNLPEVESFSAGFEVNDEREASSKIAQILLDHKLREQMSKNALQLAAHFDIRKRAIDLNKIYDSIL